MEKLSNTLVNKMLQRNIILPNKIEIYQNGIMLILADVINFSLILIIGAVIGSVLYSVTYITMLWMVRRFCGGFHAQTYGMCRAVTVGTYILILLVENMIHQHYVIIALTCCIFSIITMIAFAPIRHPNKELTLKEVKVNKLFAVFTTSSFSALSTVLTAFNCKEGVVISLVLLAISILMYVGMLTNGKGGEQK